MAGKRLCEGTGRRQTFTGQREKQPCWHLALALVASRTVRKCLLFKPLSSVPFSSISWDQVLSPQFWFSEVLPFPLLWGKNMQARFSTRGGPSGSLLLLAQGVKGAVSLCCRPWLSGLEEQCEGIGVEIFISHFELVLSYVAENSRVEDLDTYSRLPINPFVNTVSRHILGICPLKLVSLSIRSPSENTRSFVSSLSLFFSLHTHWHWYPCYNLSLLFLFTLPGLLHCHRYTLCQNPI